MLKKGDELEAVVIDIDKQNQRISLGVKQLDGDPWKDIDTKYKIGDLVTGKVTKLASFGAFVQLKDDIDGLVHISQLSEDHVSKVKDILKVGQEVEARVIKVDKAERRIGLSVKAANYSEEDLKRESEAFDNLRPGEDMVGLEQAFQAAQEEYRRAIRRRRSNTSNPRKIAKLAGRKVSRFFAFALGRRKRVIRRLPLARKIYLRAHPDCLDCRNSEDY